jgi:hypothetical protein
MSPFSKSKRVLRVVIKKKALPSLIHHLMCFRVFKAYGIKSAIDT